MYKKVPFLVFVQILSIVSTSPIIETIENPLNANIIPTLLNASSVFDALSNLSKLNPLLKIGKNEQLTFQELASEISLVAEEHEVITEDGYILKMFRIKGDPKRPALLSHGFWESSDDFIVRGNTSLTKLLANEGYDVWLLNLRGNRYSRKHVSLDPDRDSRKFFDFSFHEWGVYDLPACIDHVLNQTGADSLYSIGFSQGTQINFVMGSVREEYNKKVKAFVALAPIAYMQHFPRSLLQYLSDAVPVLGPLFDTLGIVEIFNENGLPRNALKYLATIDGIGAALYLYGFLLPVGGFDPEEIELDYVSTVAAHFPGSVSVKDPVHLSQLNRLKRFAQFDYGEAENLKKYNSSLPPLYDMSKVTMNVVLLQGLNDSLSTVPDTELLISNLTNANVTYTVIKKKKWAHFDFVFGRNAHKYVYKHVLNSLAKYK